MNCEKKLRNGKRSIIIQCSLFVERMENRIDGLPSQKPIYHSISYHGALRMGRSWFSQTSSVLALLHNQIGVCARDPENRKERK